jgi:2-haloacid dehalogenase
MAVSRRTLLVSSVAAAALCGTAAPASSSDGPALFFDVFGTLVDWRSSIAREAKAALEPRGFRLDWLGFADAWAMKYQPALDAVRTGARPYTRLDELNLESLEGVLLEFGVKALPQQVVIDLNLAWHRLDAWPDVPDGMRRLARIYRLATVSNGNATMMADLAGHNGIAFDAYLGAEVAHNFKPKPEVYVASANALGLEPAACLMVAAHSYDLEAAKRLGMMTAHVARPDEGGPGQGEAAPDQDVKVDFAAKGLDDLARLLGA